ncbi:putative type VI secretion system effector [Xanthomonas oryzae pv. oryzicola]|uniref:putative type VI secretion system effector n=1 Tax=Xanthomonas oryzae TaxID=347 RepID=UPI001A93325A|nr:putative type VI secretion system effector [Xanthomonas oryzae]
MMIESVNNNEIIVLRGRLEKYEAKRIAGDFLINEADRQMAGLTAIGAALAGSGGAIGLASMLDAREQATKVDFEMDSHKVSGILMWSPFDEGDDVEVVAESSPDGSFRAFAVLRPSDRIIALYPHCVRGVRALIRFSLKWFLIIFIPIYIFIIGSILFMLRHSIDLAYAAQIAGMGGLAGAAVYALVGVRLVKRFVPFARMSEVIFNALDWKDFKNIDLALLSRMERKNNEMPGLGILYFKY